MLSADITEPMQALSGSQLYCRDSPQWLVQSLSVHLCSSEPWRGRAESGDWWSLLSTPSKPITERSMWSLSSAGGQLQNQTDAAAWRWECNIFLFFTDPYFSFEWPAQDFTLSLLWPSQPAYICSRSVTPYWIHGAKNTIRQLFWKFRLSPELDWLLHRLLVGFSRLLRDIIWWWKLFLTSDSPYLLWSWYWPVAKHLSRSEDQLPTPFIIYWEKTFCNFVLRVASLPTYSPAVVCYL